MNITINFASQPYEQAQRFLLRWKLIISGAALLAVVLLYGSIAAYLSWRTTSKQVTELRRQIDEQDRRKSEAETYLNRPENWQIRVRAELLNSAFARKAFSWTEVFTDLEHIVPSRLHVTSIQPVVNDDDELELHLVVSGSAREAAIELVRHLEQSQHFARAQINDEKTQSSQGAQSPGNVIQYSITAIYIPGFERGKAMRETKETSQAGIAPAEVAAGQHEIWKEAGNAGH